MTEIIGENDQEFMPNVRVLYAVNISNEYCAETSSCGTVIINTNGIEQNELGVSIYPNPSDNFLFINSGSEIQQISLFSLNGSIIKEYEGLNRHSQTIDIDLLFPGVYIFEVYPSSKQCLLIKN